ncbi:UNVERIFIED_CONTAM: hypothetical protein RF648_19850, partial [Kocuria sp. CPCC 205274]
RGTDEIKQFGNVVAEDLPDSIGSSKSPEYQEWKTKLDAAAKELSNRNQKTDAAFLRHFGDVVEKGLKRREELPDRPDLVITQTDYEQLRGLYNKTRKGEELDIGEAGNVQMGNMGQKLRTLLLGDASASTRQSKIKFNSDKLNAERRKALAAEHGTGDFGEALPDIVAKPANNEGSIPTPKAEKAPEPKPQRAAKPALTEQETAIKKQEAKIKRLQNRLNNDELWIHDDDRGTKWKVAQSQLKMEKYNLEQ